MGASPAARLSSPLAPLGESGRYSTEILSLSRSSIYQLIRTDQLVPIRIGRCVRFSVDQLEQFVENRVSASPDTEAG